MFKKLAALGAALMLCFSLAGCGSTGKDITVDVNALASELKDGVTWQDTLEEIDPNVLSMMSDYDIEGVEKSVVYLGSGATAEEITGVYGCGCRKKSGGARNEAAHREPDHLL